MAFTKPKRRRHGSFLASDSPNLTQMVTPTLLTITSPTVTNVTSTTATLGGDVTGNGGGMTLGPERTSVILTSGSYAASKPLTLVVLAGPAGANGAAVSPFVTPL